MPAFSLLHSLSLPLPQACTMGCAGLALLLFRRYRSGVLALALAGGWLYLCATPAFAMLLRAALESQHPYQPAAAYPQVDAIVVFAGDGVPHTGDWNDEGGVIASRRIGYAYQLYRAGRARVVVLAGGDGGAAGMATALLKQGVPASALRVESQSLNTHENARNASLILQRENLRRVLLVTSPAHMPRALASLARQGIDVTPASAMPTQALPASSPWMPHRVGVRQVRHYLHEYIGLWVYRLRGWA